MKAQDYPRPVLEMIAALKRMPGVLLSFSLMFSWLRLQSRYAQDRGIQL